MKDSLASPDITRLTSHSKQGCVLQAKLFIPTFHNSWPLAQPALYRARATVGAFRPDRIPIKTGHGLRLCGFPFGIVSGVFRARPSLEMNFFCFFSDTWAQIAIGSLQLANRGALWSGRTGSSEFPKSWIVSGVFSSQKTCGGRLSDKKRQLFRRHLPKQDLTRRNSEY